MSGEGSRVRRLGAPKGRETLGPGGPQGGSARLPALCPTHPRPLTFCPGEMRALTCFSTGFRELS